MSEENLDFFSAVIFNKNAAYQEVYTSQNYGTFYGIYMSFGCEIDESKSLITLTDLKFKIINYKGVVNLGIKDVKFVINNYNQPQFNVSVQAMLGLREYDYGEQEMDFSTLKKMLVIERTILKQPNFDSNENPNDNSVLVFDEEYYYRDGTNKPQTRTVRAGMEGFNGAVRWKRCYQSKNVIILE